jgi:phosphoribosylformimino-5-aminoimidazole carboxamide ribotide isomerase
MIIIPSIDIKAGKSVRLIQGDFNQTSIYSNSPKEMAKIFKSNGADILHIVDLDGAKAGKIMQLEIISDIVKAFDGPIQVGGGIRKKSDIDRLFAIGVERVVIGTSAAIDILQTKNWLKEYGSKKIVLALDFKMAAEIPYIAISGWQEKTSQNLWQLLQEYPEIYSVLCTDIRKDGMQIGPNFKFYQELKTRHPNLNIQASGGISTIQDIIKLQILEIGGAIIGKAIYENKISLTEAIKCLK